VKPAPFAYCRPSTTLEVTEALAADGDGARVLAGGQSLVPLLNARRVRPRVLIDVNRVAGLHGIDGDAGVLEIRAMTRQAEAIKSPAIRSEAALLAEALPHVGHPETRTRGTIGGSLAFADPVAEIPAVVLALEGTVVLHSLGHVRELPAHEFLAGPGRTAARSEELLTAIRLPRHGPGYAFEEMRLRRYEFALVAVAVLLSLDSSGRLANVRVAYAGMGDRALRATTTERALRGADLTETVLSDACREAVGELDPPTDVHAPARFRSAVAVALTRRAFERAIARSSLAQ
jgi:carbon-monoxide dehydrogenase medium subunit